MPVDGIEIRQLLCSTDAPVHRYGTQQWPRLERVCARKVQESGLSVSGVERTQTKLFSLLGYK